MKPLNFSLVSNNIGEYQHYLEVELGPEISCVTIIMLGLYLCNVALTITQRLIRYKTFQALFFFI